MSLVHEKLYASNDFSSINMKDYTQSMTNYLFRAIAPKAKVNLILHIKDIFIDLNRAIPCGLIMNELISNALKHAFVNKSKGKIEIDFLKTETDFFELTVRDDGIGIPDDIDIHTSESLGLKIANMLTNQIAGTVQMKRDHGTVYQIQFPVSV